MVYTVHLVLDAPTSVLTELSAKGIGDLEPAVHALGRHNDGVHAAVMLADIEAESEAAARFKAFRMWDKCEALTGIRALSAIAFRDLAEEARR